MINIYYIRIMIFITHHPSPKKNSLAQHKTLHFSAPAEYFLSNSLTNLPSYSIYIHMLTYGPVSIHTMGYDTLVGYLISFMSYNQHLF